MNTVACPPMNVWNWATRCSVAVVVVTERLYKPLPRPSREGELAKIRASVVNTYAPPKSPWPWRGRPRHLYLGRARR